MLNFKGDTHFGSLYGVLLTFCVVGGIIIFFVTRVLASNAYMMEQIQVAEAKMDWVDTEYVNWSDDEFDIMIGFNLVSSNDIGTFKFVLEEYENGSLKRTDIIPNSFC